MKKFFKYFHRDLYIPIQKTYNFLTFTGFIPFRIIKWFKDLKKKIFIKNCEISNSKEILWPLFSNIDFILKIVLKFTLSNSCSLILLPLYIIFLYFWIGSAWYTLNCECLEFDYKISVQANITIFDACTILTMKLQNKWINK